jgi:hypothetical protein
MHRNAPFGFFLVDGGSQEPPMTAAPLSRDPIYALARAQAAPLSTPSPDSEKELPGREGDQKIKKIDERLKIGK